MAGYRNIRYNPMTGAYVGPELPILMAHELEEERDREIAHAKRLRQVGAMFSLSRSGKKKMDAAVKSHMRRAQELTALLESEEFLDENLMNGLRWLGAAIAQGNTLGAETCRKHLAERGVFPVMD